jgi:hypothetical protein
LFNIFGDGVFGGAGTPSSKIRPSPIQAYLSELVGSLKSKINASSNESIAELPEPKIKIVINPPSTGVGLGDISVNTIYSITHPTLFNTEIELESPVIKGLRLVNPEVIGGVSSFNSPILNFNVKPNIVDATGRFLEPTVRDGQYTIQWEQGGPGFLPGDLIYTMMQDYDKDGNLVEMYKVKAEVLDNEVEGFTSIRLLEGFDRVKDLESNKDGIEFVRIGNKTNTDRQGVILITSDGIEPDASDKPPYIDVKDGIDSFEAFYEDLPKVRLGRLDGITDPWLGSLSGYGLYSSNVFLRGKFVIASGSSIDNSIFNDSLLNNPTFSSYASAVAGVEDNLGEVQTFIGNYPAGTTLNTVIQQNSEEILLQAAAMIDDEVTSELIVSKINIAPGTIKISADKINFSGLSSFSLAEDDPNRVVISGTNITLLRSGSVLTGELSRDGLFLRDVQDFPLGGSAQYGLSQILIANLTGTISISNGGGVFSNTVTAGAFNSTSFGSGGNYAMNFSAQKTGFHFDNRINVPEIQLNGINVEDSLNSKAPKMPAGNLFTFLDDNNQPHVFRVNADGTFTII